MRAEEELKVQKKIQIMLPLWLGDYLETSAEKYELSISELARIQICFAIITHSDNLFPEYKPEIPMKIMSQKIFKFFEGDDREGFLRCLSDIYFETRKAVNFRIKMREKEGMGRKVLP